MAVCSIPGCGKPFVARGWCRMHYSRWYTTGSLEEPTGHIPRLVLLGVKPCSRCGLVLPPEGFTSDVSVAGGRRSRCRDCENESRRQRRVENPGQHAAQQRAWLEKATAADPEFWAKRYAAHRESNKRHSKAAQQKRRAARRGSPAQVITAAEWADRLAEFGGRCAYCLTAEGTEQDHMTPISRGGAHTLSNVVPACRRCNARKGAKTLLEFAGVT